jgi:hypothetical protein
LVGWPVPIPSVDCRDPKFDRRPSEPKAREGPSGSAMRQGAVRPRREKRSFLSRTRRRKAACSPERLRQRRRLDIENTTYGTLATRQYGDNGDWLDRFWSGLRGSHYAERRSFGKTASVWPSSVARLIRIPALTPLKFMLWNPTTEIAESESTTAAKSSPPCQPGIKWLISFRAISPAKTLSISAISFETEPP